MKNPVIGITLDAENNQNYSKFPWYASRKNYSDSVVLAGGTPLFLPHNLSIIEEFIEVIDGIIITGGDFDIDPKIYGEKVKSKTASGIIFSLIPYIEKHLSEGGETWDICKHLINLVENIPKAKIWRKQISAKSIKRELSINYLIKMTIELQKMGY